MAHFPKLCRDQSSNEFFRITGLPNTQHFSGKWTALVGHRVLVGSGSNRVQGAGFDAIDFLSVPPAQGQKCCGDRGHAAPRGCTQSSLAPFSSLQPSSPVSSFGPRTFSLSLRTGPGFPKTAMVSPKSRLQNATSLVHTGLNYFCNIQLS